VDSLIFFVKMSSSIGIYLIIVKQIVLINYKVFTEIVKKEIFSNNKN
jgi:hypothetical protein